MKTTNMSIDIDKILIQYLTGSATEKEKEDALPWIKKSKDNEQYFNELKKLHHLTKIIQKPSGFSKEEAWERIQTGYYKQRYISNLEQNKRKIKRLYRIVTSVAAVLIFAVLIGLFHSRSGFRSPYIAGNETFNEIVAPLGSRSQVTLSDGTSVWLNAGSTLRYPAHFDNGKREVYLEGEAFFDVAKGKKLFLVKTSDLNIKVFGTKFNVKSYPEEDHIETTLVEGSLAIEPFGEKNHVEPLMLKPNQKVTYNKGTQTKNIQKKDILESITENVVEEKSGEVVIATNVDPVPITSWKDSAWVFSREPLDELAIKLERRFNVKISFEEESLKDYRFTGTLKDENIEQVLGILQIGAPVLFTIEKNKVIFKEDPTYRIRYDSMISNPN